MQRDHALKRHHLSIDRRELEEFVGDDVFGQGGAGNPGSGGVYSPTFADTPTRRSADPFPRPPPIRSPFPHPLPTRNVRARIQSLD